MVRKIVHILTLVQISFLKTSYLGQHNEDRTVINPIMPLNTLFLGLLRPYGQSFDPYYFRQQNGCIKKEKGNLILQTAKTFPKS